MNLSAALTVHGLELSYFTGKLEAYLRARGLDYRLEEMDTRSFAALAHKTGVRQMPHLETPDGRFLTDTPLIIDALEAQLPLSGTISPRDGAACFISHVLEDYFDEWLWCPALYYRWAFAEDARLMSSRIARTMLRDLPLPFALRRWLILERQRRTYLRGEGVTRHNASAIEALYHSTLAALQAVLAQRDFVQGHSPTRADFGLFGSMFRHFSSDPTPARWMRAKAPAVLAWTGRMWALRPDAFSRQAPVSGAPSGLEPILARLNGEFLPYCAANAAAFAKGQKRLAFALGPARIQAKVNAYRAWRFARLQQLYRAQECAARGQIDGWLGPIGAEILAAPSAPLPQPNPIALRDRRGHEISQRRRKTAS